MNWTLLIVTYLANLLLCTILEKVQKDEKPKHSILKGPGKWSNVLFVPLAAYAVMTGVSSLEESLLMSTENALLSKTLTYITLFVASFSACFVIIGIQNIIKLNTKGKSSKEDVIYTFHLMVKVSIIFLFIILVIGTKLSTMTILIFIASLILYAVTYFITDTILVNRKRI